MFFENESVETCYLRRTLHISSIMKWMPRAVLGFCVCIAQTSMAYDASDFNLTDEQVEESSHHQLFLMGKRHHDGDGVKQDYTQAHDFYLKAAALGNNDARINLGYMYFIGEGVQQNYGVARSWYLEASETEIARENLAAMYERGLGVKIDLEAAKVWRNEAFFQTQETIQISPQPQSNALYIEEVSVSKFEPLELELNEYRVDDNEVFLPLIRENSTTSEGEFERPLTVIPKLAQLSSSVDVGAAPVSFRRALDAAYASDARLLAARQEFEISKTDISLAKSGRRPSIEANGSYGYLDQSSNFTDAESSSISGDTNNLSISLTQPLFRGFQTRNGVSEATSLSLANQLQIEAVKQAVFLDVVTAYLGVQRDLNILKLNQQNLETLQGQLKANEKRYELKDASLTDVARSRAAVASVVSRNASVRGDYADTRSTFFRLTGLSADNLVRLEGQPVSLPEFDDFVKAVQNRNASVLAAKHALEASEFALKEAKGARLPTVDFSSSVGRNEGPVNFGLFSDNRVTTSANANVTVRVPIYQAGQEFDNIKRAKQVRRLREIELLQVSANVRDAARTIWDRLGSSKEALASYEVATQAAETAAIGTREIYRSGLISAIDLIDTEQRLLDTKIEQERARHDHLIALYTLFSLLGETNF